MPSKTDYDSKYEAGCTWIRRVGHDQSRSQCDACHCTFLLSHDESQV